MILILEERVALIRRVHPDSADYVFPGGGVEYGEMVEEAARREAHEELGLEVRLDHLVAIVEHRGAQQYYYAASITGGTLGTGTGAELGLSVSSGRGSYMPVWIGINHLLMNDVRPRAVAHAISARSLESQRAPLRIVES
ncbi:MAG: NUDIX domain-containing protein [Chloroflexia bacterium]|nr:NUDIX domain-containing protein [Chloroflexia bacterium]